jgi:hypothetical protein
MNRHVVRAGLAAAATIAALAGCQPQPPQSPQTNIVQQQPLAQAKPVVTPPEPTATEPTTSVALAQKMQSWAQEMGPLMSKRTKKPGEPTDVDFLDPGEFRIGPAATPTVLPKKEEQPVQIVQIAHPTEDSTQTVPNQRATIASAQAGVGAGYPKTRIDAAAGARGGAAVKDATGASDLDVTISRNVHENPKETWAQLDYQLLQFLKDKPTPQLDVMGGMSNEDRELIAAVMDGLSNFRNGIRADNNMLMSRKVRPFLELADRLRAQADLTIPTLALCTAVDGYAAYTPIEPARFVAMKENKIIVYCEVENFASHLNDKKLWETKLSQEVVLYTETGLPVWQVKTQSIPDLARTRRHDFFLVNKTAFPPNITIGRYLLKVTVVDQQASRVAEATLPVLFVAQ